MRALVVGYGSIGQRHARVLQTMGCEVGVVSRRAVEVQRLYPDIPSALRGFAPEYVVIASRTSEHYGDFATLAASGFIGKVLVEKPLFAEPAPLPTHEFEGVWVGYALRFHPTVQRFRAQLATTTVHELHVHCGQHLAGWRARDYRESYSARRAEGGGALRDLSHELDYAVWMLGPWTEVKHADGGHQSALAIDSDDTFKLSFAAARCPRITVELNYLDDPPQRWAGAVTDAGMIRMDLMADPIEIDRILQAEHTAAVAKDGAIACSLEEGLDIVRLIAAAEASARVETVR